MSDDTIIPEDLKIHQDFIDENKLVKTSQKSAKGGPYTITERSKRREEVYRLNFELGIPASKISEMMGINRNTINSDIQFLYDQLGKEWDYHDITGLVMRQIQRLENQRSRQIENLEKENDIETQLSIERLILEIDNKISQYYIHTSNSQRVIMKNVTKILNEWFRKEKLGRQLVNNDDLISVAEEDYDNIAKMITESKSKVKNRKPQI